MASESDQWNWNRTSKPIEDIKVGDKVIATDQLGRSAERTLAVWRGA